MLGLGAGELVIVALVLLVLVGPERLPQFMRWAGRAYGQLRRAADDLRRAFVIEADRMDAEERLKKLQDRRERAEARRRAMETTGPGTVPQDPVAPTPQAEGEPEPPAAPVEEDAR